MMERQDERKGMGIMIFGKGLSLRNLLLGMVCFLVVYYIVQGLFHARENQLRQARDGVLDLTDWDFDRQGTVRMDGQWELYWGRMVMPGQPAVPTGLYDVPRHWKGTLNGTALQSKGAATYRLVVKVKPSSRIYGIRIANIQMSSAVYVDGVKVGGSGVPDISADAYKAENKPYVAHFTITGGQTEIVVQAANFTFVQGGIPYSIVFGTDTAIRALDKRTTSIDIVVVIAILMLGIYHIGAYASRRDAGLLYLSLYCIAAAVAFSSISDKLFVQVFDWLPFQLSYKIQNVAIYLQIVMMLQFIRTTCRGLVPEWFIRTCTFIFAAGLLSVVLTPHRLYSTYTFAASTLQLIVYIAVIGMLSAAYRKGRYGSLSKRTLMLAILAFGGLSVCLFDNTAYLLNKVPANYLGNAGIVFCGMTLSLMLSLRYSEAFAVIETISDKLREADGLKNRFLINTSHEFQTPLNGIMTISSSMLEGALGEVNERQRHSLSMIVAVSRKLSALVYDFLDMEKVKRNELRLNPVAVDVKAVVSVVLELFHYLTQGKNIRLLADIPDDLPLVAADEDRLMQVVSNLIGNAVKFTEQGDVTVSARQEEGRVFVTVEDTGIGIPPESRERIFEPFAQASGGTADEYGGVGLGLSISRELMQRMNGEIRLDWSEPGKGTRFGICLPVAASGTIAANSPRRPELPRLSPQPPDHDRSEAAAAAEPAAFTLLAVDDEPSNLQALSDLFAGQGGRVLTATNGQDALRQIRARRDIDLVLLDVMMPKMSGFEVCRQIRRTHSLFELPVILLTVRNTSHDFSVGFEAGANDYMVKPFDATEVRARVSTLLSLKKSVRDALAAEMAFLQSQIKPHFLFNALNSIISFCYTDSAKAGQLVSSLAQYLQSSFDIPGTNVFVPLKDELRLVKAYVEIEQARFEERLTVEYDMDDLAMYERFLPLTIQPLVENAIRHGVTKKEEGGSVKLTVKQTQDTITVEVWDNGVGMSPRKLESVKGIAGKTDRAENGGVGLANIDRRLRSFYGTGLRINSAEGEWTNVSFQIPAGTAAPSRRE